MTTDEIQELRDWAARKMGWIPDTTNRYYINLHGPYNNIQVKIDVLSWLPDNPATGQIWMLVEKLRDEGWEFRLENCDSYLAQFVRVANDKLVSFDEINPNPCLAILKAARATEG